MKISMRNRQSPEGWKAGNIWRQDGSPFDELYRNLSWGVKGSTNIFE